jgi:hypothetical protein
MLFFDWADPPMLIGKALLYLSREENDIYQRIADICMGIFVALSACGMDCLDRFAEDFNLKKRLSLLP